MATWSDSFNGTANAQLRARTGWQSLGSPSASGGVRISSGGTELQYASTGSSSNWDMPGPNSSNRPSSADHYVRAIIRSTSTLCVHLAVRVSDTGASGVGLRLTSATAFDLFTWTSFGGTLSGAGGVSTGFNFTPGDGFELRASGTTYTVTQFVGGFASPTATNSWTFTISGFSGQNVATLGRGAGAVASYIDEWTSSEIAGLSRVDTVTLGLALGAMIAAQRSRPEAARPGAGLAARIGATRTRVDLAQLGLGAGAALPAGRSRSEAARMPLGLMPRAALSLRRSEAARIGAGFALRVGSGLRQAAIFALGLGLRLPAARARTEATVIPLGGQPVPRASRSRSEAARVPLGLLPRAATAVRRFETLRAGLGLGATLAQRIVIRATPSLRRLRRIFSGRLWSSE